MSASSDDGADLLGSAFREQRLHADGWRGAGGAASATAVRRRRSSRAMPVGVSLVDGDLELGATGTVTHIDGDRVYAFGHPIYNLGPTSSR